MGGHQQMQRCKAKNYAQRAIPNHFSNFNLENPTLTGRANMRFFLLKIDVVHCAILIFTVCLSMRRFPALSVLADGWKLPVTPSMRDGRMQGVEKMFAKGDGHSMKACMILNGMPYRAFGRRMLKFQ